MCAENSQLQLRVCSKLFEKCEINKKCRFESRKSSLFSTLIQRKLAVQPCVRLIQRFLVLNFCSEIFFQLWSDLNQRSSENFLWCTALNQRWLSLIISESTLIGAEKFSGQKLAKVKKEGVSQFTVKWLEK